VQALSAVSASVGNNLLVSKSSSEGGRVLGCDYHLISHSSFLHPIADVLFRLSLLVVIGSGRGLARSQVIIMLACSRVNEVAPIFVEVIENSFRRLPVTFSKMLCPRHMLGSATCKMATSRDLP
jgi:hypothetical protein